MPNGDKKDKLPSQRTKELPSKSKLKGELGRAMGSASIIKRNPNATKRQKNKADSLVNSVYDKIKKVAKQKKLRKDSKGKAKKINRKLRNENLNRVRDMSSANKQKAKKDLMKGNF